MSNRKHSVFGFTSFREVVSSIFALVALYISSVFLATSGLYIFLSVKGVEAARMQTEIADSNVYNFVFIGLAMFFELVIFFVVTKVWGAKLDFLKAKNFVQSLWYVPIGLVIYYLFSGFALQVLSGVIDTDQKQQIGFQNVQGPLELSMVFLALVVLAPLAEEILFRGFLFGVLRKYYRFAVSAFMVSIIFGLFHLQIESGNPPLWSAAVDTAILSVVACYLREKSGHIWYGVALHSAKNFVAFTLLFIFNIS